MPLYTVVVDVLGDARYRVTSALPTRPVAGDRIRYADVVELDVVHVVLGVGTGGDVEVLATPTIAMATTVTRRDLAERLESLRFRREAQDVDPAPAAP